MRFDYARQLDPYTCVQLGQNHHEYQHTPGEYDCIALLTTHEQQDTVSDTIQISRKNTCNGTACARPMFFGQLGGGYLRYTPSTITQTHRINAPVDRSCSSYSPFPSSTVSAVKRTRSVVRPARLQGGSGLPTITAMGQHNQRLKLTESISPLCFLNSHCILYH